MTYDLGMRYKKVVAVALHANSEKNQILRQCFANELVNLLSQGKRIINVDESWLGMTDFRRMKWQPRGENNSVAHLQVAPRISIIMGIDTSGAIYLSLLQCNNTSSTMELFFKSLVKKLDNEDDGWRRNTVIMLDNVSCQHQASILSLL